MKHGILWGLIGLLLLAICGVALYRVWPMLHPEIAVQVPADPACDLRAGPCISSLGEGTSVSFSIEPQEIPLVKPLQLRVELQGVEASSIEVDFSGVDMDMGFNRVRLEPVGKGSYSANGMLPVCVRDAMEWEAKVLLRSQEGLSSVAYRFITVRPGMPVPKRIDD
jgi:hypothetical protein